MTTPTSQSTFPEELLELLAQEGLDAMPRAITLLLNGRPCADVMAKPYLSLGTGR